MSLAPVLIPVLLGAFALDKPTTYVMKDKSTIRAEALELDGNRVRLRVYFPGGGTAEGVRKLSDFDPHSAFRIKRAAMPPNDVTAQVELATFAMEHGLISAAFREIEKATHMADAQKIPESLREELREHGVKAMEGLLRSLVSEGKVKDARRVLTRLFTRFPNNKLTDDQKGRLIGLVEQAEATTRAKAATAKKAEAKTAEDKARESRLSPIRKRLEDGKNARKKGLMISKSYSRAYSEFQRAVRAFDDVEKRSDALIKRYSSDGILVAQCKELTKEAKALKIDALLAGGGLKLANSQYREAMSAANQVLLIEANNKRALQLRARVELASNDYGGWGRRRW